MSKRPPKWSEWTRMGSCSCNRKNCVLLAFFTWNRQNSLLWGKNYYLRVKPGVHLRRSRIRNQKRRVLRSSENQTAIALLIPSLIKWKPNLVSGVFPLPVSTGRGETWERGWWKHNCRSHKRKQRNKPIKMLENEHYDWLILPLLLATPTILFSLDRKRRHHKRNRKKMETFWFLRLWFRRA